MGIGERLWPFERKISQIPCAREAGIASLSAGPCLGALVLIFKRRPILAFKTTLYSSAGILWGAFGICRINEAGAKLNSESFNSDLSSGKID